MSCKNSNSTHQAVLTYPEENTRELFSADVITAAEQTDKYLPLLKGKKVALVVNHTALVKNTHLVDTLLSLGINISAIYAPEHGFRGEQDDGATVQDAIDSKTGIPLKSVYGKKKKPTPEDLHGIDIV
ncbi:MAG: exo-beta-N-acetylmuramidase NamZ domain-containing protein, partial [Chitinophagales bacterium]